MSRLRVSSHAAFQLAWAGALTVPLATKVTQMIDRARPGVALGIIEITGIWALGAFLAWSLRVVAITGSGRWGARTRQRVREAGRRPERAG
jgi:hypothetical protein